MKFPGAIPTNNQQQAQRHSSVEGNKPFDNALQVEWGMIIDVGEDNQVKVKLIDGRIVNVVGEDDPKKGARLPVINEISDIEMRWGKLYKGMFCRVWWRGHHGAIRGAVVEVIGKKGFDMVEQKPNDPAASPPHKMFGAGGM